MAMFQPASQKDSYLNSVSYRIFFLGGGGGGGGGKFSRVKILANLDSLRLILVPFCIHSYA